MAHPHPKLESAWTALWPGLPALWYYGSLRGLITALIFSDLLILGVLATAVWPDLLRTGPKAVVCFSVVAIWACFSGSQIRSQLRQRKALRSNGNLTHLFRAAQTEYLQRNWFQAETLLCQLLAVHPDDNDARFLYATLLRRIGRVRDAKQELDFVEQFSASRKWAWEVREEKRLLALPVEVTTSLAIEAA